LTIIIGGYARVSGKMISSLVANTLVDLGLSTTPTVKVAVPLENADSSIVLTASHNPKQWNTLKLGVKNIELYNAPNGKFPQNPDPLKEHLADIFELVVKEKAALGIVVDPDLDRLAFVSED
jgi:phosphomannomutase